MAWKDLFELAPQLTDREIRFEKTKRLVGLFLGPACFFFFLFSPPYPHVSTLGMRSLAIFSLAAVWWISEAIPIPVTSLLVLPLVVLCGILPYERAFGYWAHWANIFLIGAFILGHAMQLHGLTRRFSLSLVASRFVAGDPWRLLVFFLVANVIVTGFISNTVSAVLFLSMGVGLLETMKIKPGSTYALAMFLGIAWATNVGAVLTPSGTPTNLIAVGLVQSLGYRIGYTQWVMGAFPFMVLQVFAMLLILRFSFGREDTGGRIPQELIQEELRQLGPFSRGEKIASIAMLVALVGWTVPDIVPLIIGRDHPVSVWMIARLNWGVVSLLVASMLFLIPVDWKARQFAMTWDEAAKNIEWGTLALVGGALAVGELVGNKEVGVGNLFAHMVAAVAGPQTSRYLFLLVTITVAVILTNLVTNVAVVSALGPIASSVAPGLGLNPVALLVTVSLASTIGYATPMANPPCAIVFASGNVRILEMLKRGTLLSIAGILLLSFVGYPVLDRIYPWPMPGR